MSRNCGGSSSSRASVFLRFDKDGGPWLEMGNSPADRQSSRICMASHRIILPHLILEWPDTLFQQAHKLP